MSATDLQHTLFTQTVTVAADPSLDDFLAKIKSADDDVRTAAWLRAGDVGASAVGPLAELSADESMEVARAAKRGLWQIVRHCGRPGADAERKAVTAALTGLLSDGQPVPLRRDVLWMLSEVGRTDSVAPIAAQLSNTDLREDARMSLERIPGEASLAALKSALDTVPDDFKLNIAQSLRQRGVVVPGLPCAKMVPTKQTDVKPL